MPRLDDIRLETVTVALWCTSEDEAHLQELCAERGISLDAVADITAPARRVERLATLLLINAVAGDGVTLGHYPSGAPRLTGDERHITVSHTTGMVAVAINDCGGIGIDVERERPQLRRVASRVFHNGECGDDLAALATGWTAKEAMFKAEGDRALTLIDFTIDRSPTPGNTGMGHSSNRHYRLDTCRLGEYYVTAATAIN